ncbi:MAG: DinB family protein [Planctomycetota bacterium]
MSTGSMIAAAGRIGFTTAQQMLTDIKPERFARLPMGEVGAVPTNHPAWVYGHLGLYGNYVLTLLGDQAGTDAVAAPDEWNPLFGMGSACQDDPEGTIYPAMNAIVEQFDRCHTATLEALEKTTDPAVFETVNPNEQMRDRFPTVGAAATFMITTHLALHVGQVSAWRRMEGLGSALGF